VTRAGILGRRLGSRRESEIERVRERLAVAVAAFLVACATVAGAGSAPLSSGAKLWSARYDGPAHGNDQGYPDVVSPDGTKVFVAGRALATTTGADILVVAYNSSTGAKLWSARYSGPGANSDSAQFVAVSPDGTKVFVTGSSYGGATTRNDYATIAYNASNGAKLWSARYNGPGNGEDTPYWMAVSPDGTKVFVTGDAWGGTATKDDYGTVAYNASTGAKLWSTRFNGAANGADLAYSIVAGPDGTKVFVTGFTTGGATVD
jgi:DNA-binding beta-propeller fold protein YncE